MLSRTLLWLEYRWGQVFDKAGPKIGQVGALEGGADAVEEAL